MSREEEAQHEQREGERLDDEDHQRLVAPSEAAPARSHGGDWPAAWRLEGRQGSPWDSAAQASCFLHHQLSWKAVTRKSLLFPLTRRPCPATAAEALIIF